MSNLRKLDRVKILGLHVCHVVENFGRYVKYVVTSTVSDTITGKTISANAFEALMCSTRAGPFMRRPCRQAPLFGWIWTYFCVLCKRSAVYLSWSISSMSRLFSSSCCEKVKKKQLSACKLCVHVHFFWTYSWLLKVVIAVFWTL